MLPLLLTVLEGDLLPLAVAHEDAECVAVMVAVRHSVGEVEGEPDTLRDPELQGLADVDTERVRVTQAVEVWEGERHMDGVGECEVLALREKLPEEDAEREAMELEADADPDWQPDADELWELLRDCVGLGEREGDAEKEGEADAELDVERECVALAERVGLDVPLRDAFVTEDFPELEMEGDDVGEPVCESANLSDDERDCEGEDVREGVTVPQGVLLVESEALTLPQLECVGDEVELRHSEGVAHEEMEPE